MPESILSILPDSAIAITAIAVLVIMQKHLKQQAQAQADAFHAALTMVTESNRDNITQIMSQMERIVDSNVRVEVSLTETTTSMREVILLFKQLEQQKNT